MFRYRSACALTVLCAVFFVAYGLLNTATVQAADALQILPTRLVLDKQRSGEFNLINKGTEAGNYRILVRNMRTDADGQFFKVEEALPGELFADSFIRYSPRRVSIAPGEYQKVRLTARKPKDLPDGEYRSHLVFQSLPKRQPVSAGNSNVLEVSVEPVVEVVIPIIVRQGDLDATVRLSDVSIRDRVMRLTIHREGSRSVYGDFTATISAGPYKGTQIGVVRGLSVYYPNPLRHIELDLTLPAGFKPGQDPVLVEFKEDPLYGGDSGASITYP